MKVPPLAIWVYGTPVTADMSAATTCADGLNLAEKLPLAPSEPKSWLTMLTLNALREAADAVGLACARNALVAATVSAMITSNASPATRIVEAEKRRVISSGPNGLRCGTASPLSAGEHPTARHRCGGSGSLTGR